MIAKAFRMRNNGKTSMKRLVEYLTSDQNKRHRVADILIANCTYESPELAMREMLVTQARNRRATSDKTYHLMVSFRPGEDPTPETLRAVESAVCKKLGFGEHQRIAVVHHDTDSVHLHVAINKIHPKSLEHFPGNTQENHGFLVKYSSICLDAILAQVVRELINRIQTHKNHV